MPLRRIFLLGAATIVSVAALVAIGAILNGDFGDTEGKIFATLATAFVAGSAAVAGIACLEAAVAGKSLRSRTGERVIRRVVVTMSSTSVQIRMKPSSFQ